MKVIVETWGPGRYRFQWDNYSLDVGERLSYWHDEDGWHFQKHAVDGKVTEVEVETRALPS